MPAVIIENPKFRDRSGVFQDRAQAGECLAQALRRFEGTDAMVIAIPSGGVPVGLEISSRLKLPFDLLVVRKIPIPGYTESGFGALSLEGDLLLNEPLVRQLGLSSEEIQEQAAEVREELLVRNRIFRQERPWPDVKGRAVLLVDDGLASGYTMIAACRFVRRRAPARIVVAVPTASRSTLDLLAEEAEMIVCPNVRRGRSFAVADAYRRWYDLSREDVVRLLKDRGYLRA